MFEFDSGKLGAYLMVAVISTCVCATAQAQAPSQTLASTMDVYVFPTDKQDSAQQSKDEADCYSWAESNTGTDPFDLSKQQQATQQQGQAEMAAAQQTGAGSGVRGALVGGATGALIGEIASDDAGKGAVWGAAIGGIAARRRGMAAQQNAVQQTQAQQQGQQQSLATQVDNFKKAFSVCLEAKKYMVKY
jgi:hypothetical protein